jgi:hypothetical protein
MSISQLRKEYHQRICAEIIRVTKNKDASYPNFADGSNKSSRDIAWGITRLLGHKPQQEKIDSQTMGDRFELATRDFLEAAFLLLEHIRPGKWVYQVKTAISKFYQFEHLRYLEEVVKSDRVLSSAFGGDYIVKPDIVVGRCPVTDKEVNSHHMLIRRQDNLAKLTPLRVRNQEVALPLLHASISCKWTIRSDRSQNTRTEALNLIRNRKGHLPHVVAVTAEPLPSRLATLALGTGDLDCVYHFALPELSTVIEDLDNQDQLDMLRILMEGRRLRDISDLPFDLAI